MESQGLRESSGTTAMQWGDPPASFRSESESSGAGREEETRAGAILENVAAALDGLVAIDFQALNPEALQEIARKVATQAVRLQAMWDRAVGAIDTSSAWEGSGSRTLPEFIRETTGASHRVAARTVARAKALNTDLPLFRHAYEAGEISEEKVDIVAKLVNTDRLKEALRDPVHGEESLLALARTRNGDVFQRQVRSWSIQHDPKDAEERLESAVRAERITLVPQDDGWAINGWLTALNGEIVNVALDAAMGVPTSEDTRQPTERRAAALCELLKISLDEGRVNTAAKIRPHLSIHVPFEVLSNIAPHEGTGVGAENEGVAVSEGDGDVCEACGDIKVGDIRGGDRSREVHLAETQNDKLGQPGDSSEFRGGRQCRCMKRVRAERHRAGEILSIIRAGISPDLLTGSPPASLDDGTPINHSELQTLLCTGDIQRTVLSQSGEVLDVGQKSRIATPKQARAVVARDRTCRYPGCTHTVSSSEIHHSDHWEDGGPTDLDNLIMLCWYHHRFVHQRRITISHHQRGWVFSDPAGFIGSTAHGVSGEIANRVA